MPNPLLLESPCYYASPEYAQTFWGKYFWLYQGQGQLRLTDECLSFTSPRRSFKLPFSAITGLETGLFSPFAKFLGLGFMALHYWEHDQATTLLLVPAASGFAPTWVTNQRILTWIETLRQIPALGNRVHPSVTLPTRPFA